jgi:F-box/WD-40 domain protein 7
MSSDSVGLLSSPDRSNSPTLNDHIVQNNYDQIFNDYTGSIYHQPRSPSKRQLTIEESLITTNDPKRLCNSNLREQIDLNLIPSTSLHTPLSSCSSNSIDSLSIPSSPPTPPLSADVINWLSVFLAMSNDDRSRATEALIRTCSTNTLQLNHIKNQIEPYFQRDFIRDLPRELALHILKYLPANDLARASRTCRAWYDTCNDILLWKSLCQTQTIPLKHLPTIFDQTIENQWKRSYACHKHLEYVWQHEQPLPEPLTFRGHEDFVITCLQFDGKRIVSGSDDNSLKIWSVATGQCEQTLIGHNGGVWCSEMTDDLIVSGSTDRTIRVWNINTGICQHVLYGHTSTVRCLALHGDIVVSGSRDATVRVWNIRTGERLHMLSGHTAAVRCVCYNGKYVVSGAYDHTIRVWLPDQERCVHTLEGHTNRVYSLVFDGKHIVSGSLDCMIRVWDVEQGTCLHQLTGHLSLTSGMQLRGNILVSGNADSTVRIWNIDSGKCLHTLAGNNKHASAVTWVQVVLNYVVSSGDDGTVKLWDLKTGDFIRNLVTLESHGNGGVVWRIKCTDSALVCAAGSRNSTEDTKVIMLDFDRTTICS